MPFRPATKRTSKLRLAFDGPSGSGKSWTALSVATSLGGRIAAIDTERGSLSLYSDAYSFDVDEMAPPYEPHVLVAKMREAQAEGYSVLILDSISHFWEGEGGVLEMVDHAAEKSRGNKFAGWKVGTPAYQNMIDTMLGLDMHVIATLRTKTEWVLEENAQGKQAPKRVGTAMVMRGGIEYEFTVVGDLDLGHRITISKSRCDRVADKIYPAHREGDLAETLKTWLESGAAPASRSDIEAIKAALNAIPDPDTRRDAKRAFADQFGMPDFLLAEYVEKARAFATAQAGAPVPVSAARAALEEHADEMHPGTRDVDLETARADVAADLQRMDEDAYAGIIESVKALSVVDVTRQLAERGLDQSGNADTKRARLAKAMCEAHATAGSAEPPRNPRNETDEPQTDLAKASAIVEPLSDEEVVVRLTERELSTAGNKTARRFRLVQHYAHEFASDGPTSAPAASNGSAAPVVPDEAAEASGANVGEAG